MKKDIISQFPNDIELCYEKRFHNKVHSIEYYITIPKGGKYFAWFKTYHKQNFLFLLELDKKKNKIISLKIIRCCFDNHICYKDGTVLYGTIFKHLDHLFFNIEDVLYFKSVSVWRLSFYQKLKIQEE